MGQMLAKRDGCGQLRGQEGKGRGEELEGLERNSSNDWRYQGMVTELRFQEMERVK